MEHGFNDLVEANIGCYTLASWLVSKLKVCSHWTSMTTARFLKCVK